MKTGVTEGEDRKGKVSGKVRTGVREGEDRKGHVSGKVKTGVREAGEDRTGQERASQSGHSWPVRVRAGLLKDRC